ncbi:IlvGEDA operon leader peptide [Salmonella enterica subsp. enterica serovar Fulica]|nr:IlvGEDA operon leader peptide [Salmonella enterica subsp. enterica serovar Heidelberg]MBW8071953.1 IlvGEDA operon leader peptide [Salmonella enterica subsp. enterica serovar Fulica]HCL1557389.1 IlvGEDA operon leader peptide [Salmonella enterica subsp. enterica serovar Heidelberg]
MTALLRVISLVVISVVVIIIPPCGLHLDEERLRNQALTN